MTTIYNLRKELKEKEDKIKQLSQTNNAYNYNIDNYVNINPIDNINSMGNANELRATYHDLMNENYNLKNQLNLYESQYNNQNNVIYFDNDFNEIRNSITQNNKNDFNQAIHNLQNNIDNYTQNNYNTIIMMKDKELEKYKEQQKLRREREKQEISTIINIYDQNLIKGERENHELKMRLKELEGYFV